MITNLEYLKTALQVLESSESTPPDTIKILRIMASICQQNAERLQQHLDLSMLVSAHLPNTRAEPRVTTDFG